MHKTNARRLIGYIKLDILTEPLFLIFVTKWIWGQ